MSDQLDTTKIRVSAVLLGEPAVSVVWQLVDEIDRLTADNAGQAARIAELESSGVMTAMLLTIDGRQYGVHPNVMARIKELEAQAMGMHRPAFDMDGKRRNW